MSHGVGEWANKWVIMNEKTGRPHLILDTESECDQAMDAIERDAIAYNEMMKDLFMI